MPHPILYRRNAKRIMERQLDAAELRELLDLPDDATLAQPDGKPPEIVIRWTESVDAQPAEKPAKALKAKKEEAPSAPPAPIEVDWAAGLKDGRPTAADLKRAEEEIGAVRVAEVRAKNSIGAGVTVQMIALQSNARDYFDALRAAA